jgi:hypothetical protein
LKESAASRAGAAKLKALLLRNDIVLDKDLPKEFSSSAMDAPKVPRKVFSSREFATTMAGFKWVVMGYVLLVLHA